jgi:antitoxin VapB
MSLNIKNPETHKLAAELAQRTGVSMTEAVTEALREKLAALQAEASKEARLAAIMEIADRCAPLLAGVSSADIDALYDDETGLPK